MTIALLATLAVRVGTRSGGGRSSAASDGRSAEAPPVVAARGGDIAVVRTPNTAAVCPQLIVVLGSPPKSITRLHRPELMPHELWPEEVRSRIPDTPVAAALFRMLDKESGGPVVFMGRIDKRGTEELGQVLAAHPDDRSVWAELVGIEYARRMYRLQPAADATAYADLTRSALAIADDSGAPDVARDIARVYAVDVIVACGRRCEAEFELISQVSRATMDVRGEGPYRIAIEIAAGGRIPIRVSSAGLDRIATGLDTTWPSGLDYPVTAFAVERAFANQDRDRAAEWVGRLDALVAGICEKEPSGAACAAATLDVSAELGRLALLDEVALPDDPRAAASRAVLTCAVERALKPGDYEFVLPPADDALGLGPCLREQYGLSTCFAISLLVPSTTGDLPAVRP